MTESPRKKRVSDLILHQLAELLKREIYDPRLTDISLTAVRLSSDFKQARVFYTVLEQKDRGGVQAALKKAGGYLRHLLADATDLRYVPQLQFVYDESVERGAKISSLIDKALDEDRKLHKNDDGNDENE